MKLKRYETQPYVDPALLILSAIGVSGFAVFYARVKLSHTCEAGVSRSFILTQQLQHEWDRR